MAFKKMAKKIRLRQTMTEPDVCERLALQRSAA
jgi:hypothetical protein